jgi:hypothetical protein
MLMTWPGGVTAAKSKWLPGMTGPFSVRRSVMVTGASSGHLDDLAPCLERAQPSGVRYSSGLSGFSSST